MDFKPNFLATGIGSMPHADKKRALEIILNTIPEAPIWPQLSGRGLNEQMEIQYSEGMPCRVIDTEKSRMYFSTSEDYSEKFAEFYEKYLTAMDPDDGNGDCSSMAISPDFSAGIYALEEHLKQSGEKPFLIKTHTTGPVSFALTIVDEQKRALFYNEEFQDMVTKALAMKCRWQIQKFKPYAEKGIICFIDEPILSAFGSSTYVSVRREDVVGRLSEVVDAIHADDAIAGVHCCGNTEWSILMDAGVDMVNFDAYEFGGTIAMYPDHVKKHLEDGKFLAWGIVPTSQAIREETPDQLLEKLEKLIDNLSAKTGLDRDRICSQSVVTGSCGTGSMETADAEKVFETTGWLSRLLREQHGYTHPEFSLKV